jgi:hypothetical protein
MLDFKAFAAAQGTLVGIELRHMLKQGQQVVGDGAARLAAETQFYALAASSSARQARSSIPHHWRQIRSTLHAGRTGRHVVEG